MSEQEKQTPPWRKPSWNSMSDAYREVAILEWNQRRAEARGDNR